MSRKIVIAECSDCPHRDHKGAFSKIAYVPICRKANKELSYTVSNSRGTPMATEIGEIPTWCPLQENR